MKRTALPLALAFLGLGIDSHAVPLIAGLDENSSLALAEAGEALMGELQCANCHAGGAEYLFARKSGPDLSEVGQRVSSGFLMKFLANPPDAHKGARMPDLLQALPVKEREGAVEALAAFLISLGHEDEALPAWEEGDGARGKALFEEVGCLACHGDPRDGPSRKPVESLSSLAHLSDKYSASSLAQFLHEPLEVRKSGRMPDFHLSSREAADLAQFLVPGRAQVAKAEQAEPQKVRLGKRLFVQLNCVACHSLKDLPPPRPSLPLKDLRRDRGCLSGQKGNFPFYDLSSFQRKAIGECLEKGHSPSSPEKSVKQALAALNCLACHERGGQGGPSPWLSLRMKSSQEGLGDHGRIPPSLDLVGAKLKPLWMRRVMFDGQRARPYAHTRMPSFGEDNLGLLPTLFRQVDEIEEVEFPEVGRKKRGEVRSAGHKLVGDKGLNCVACHLFNGNSAGGFEGLDLLASYDRIEPSWFYRFMRSPGSLRPGIVMPSYWPPGPEGEEADGNASIQIRAIWHYLSYGQGAPTPSGVGNPGTNLEVGELARVYRGRSRIAGYRGISVGFPEGIHYAFNAETGTLSGLWKGDFVSVGWGGQGAGNFNPRSRAVQLAQDVSFQLAEAAPKAWPLRPETTKEKPVNPNPLYPKNLGYRFRGYSLDDRGIPTFSYAFGKIQMEDSSRPEPSGDVHLLRRRLSITSPSAAKILFRALAGKIEAGPGRIFATPDVRLTIPKATFDLRDFPAPGEGRELIVSLILDEGVSEFSFDYEILR